MLTDEVHALRRYSGSPGMKVLQFAFAPGENSAYLPHNQTPDSVVYTGTHDNNTLKGWTREIGADVIEYAYKYLGIPRSASLPKAMIRAAMACAAETAIVPMQDWLGLGAEARINTPSTTGGDNWRWRLRRGQLTDKLSNEIFDMTDMYGRARSDFSIDAKIAVARDVSTRER